MRCLERHYSLSLITASRSTRAPTISPSSTPRTLTMCRIIDSPRANGSDSSIPFGRQPHPLTRKRAQQQPRRTVTRKGMRSKRNPSPASERIIENAALPLTCTLARWRFRFAGLLSRVNAWPFRFVTLLRVNASVFLAKRNGDAFIVNHCIPINPRTNDIPINDTPHVNDVPHHRQPARQRKRQLHSVWTATAPPHPQESAATTTAHRDSQGQALQTESLTRQ